jgi:hypothetical protein
MRLFGRNFCQHGLPSMPVFRVALRTRIVAELARRFGVAFVIPSITAREFVDRDRYSGQDDAATAGLAEGTWPSR